MPNGSDCSCVLQTEAVRVPTQWFVFDATADGRVSGWLRADVPGEIDYLHVRPPTADGDTKAAYVAQTAALHALLDAHERRVGEGSMGRLVIWVVADMADTAGRRLLTELPLDLANALFWKTGVVPAVIRVGIGGGDQEREFYLGQVRDQYFRLPDFSGPYYGRHTPGQLYGNEFDATLLCPADDDAAAVLAHLVPLHLAETRFAKSHLHRHSPGGMMVIERVLAESMTWRKIDWFAVTAYPYFRRLWDARQDDILDVLDYARCPQRAADPWAAIKGRSREKNWDAFGLGAGGTDLLDGEAAYRVTPGDHEHRPAIADRDGDEAGLAL